jgi:hypothetical protein
VADFWIKIRTCTGDGEPTEIVADLARAIRHAADHRPWQVAIAQSSGALRTLDQQLVAIDDEDDAPLEAAPSSHAHPQTR